jgi:hypothetical protein
MRLLTQGVVHALDYRSTHVESLYDPDRCQYLLNHRSDVSIYFVGARSNLVVCPDVKAHDGEHQRYNGEQNSGESRRVDETSQYRLMSVNASVRDCIDTGPRQKSLTPTTVLNDQSRYPSLSPNPVDTSAMSFVALVLISPEPTLSKNVGSCDSTDATYANRKHSDN